MAEKRKSRDGHARKPAKDRPATVEPATVETEEATPGAKPPFDPVKTAEEMRLWWLNGGDKYIAMPESPDGDALILSRPDVMMRLRCHGISHRSGDRLHSDTDTLLIHVQEHRAVMWKGVIAGWKTGVHTINGVRVAVIRTYHLIEPRAGEWPVIRTWLESAFDDLDEPQLPYLLAWLKQGYEALRDHVFRPGYLLFIIGPSDSGKSAFQDHIAKMLFGGRAANPLPHLRERDNFNDDLCGSELQSVQELKGCKLDGQSRAELGEGLKELAVTVEMRLRAPYSPAIMVPVWRRVALSLNDEPDKLKAAPSLTGDYRDKVLMLKVRRANLTVDTSTGDGWRAFGEAVQSELPAFLHWLLYEWKMPAALLQGRHVGRFGHQSYVHPMLEEFLFLQTAESVLLRAIDSTDIFPRDDAGRVGAWGWEKEHVLQDALMEGPHRGKLEKHLYFPGACGGLLRKLLNRDPERFKFNRVTAGPKKGQHFWMILPPPE